MNEISQTPPAEPQSADVGAVIPVPQWIAATELSLAEIGAVVVIACFQTHAGGRREAWEQRMNSKEMRNVLAGLRAKKVAGVSWQDGRVHRVIMDVNAVKPA